MKKIVLSELFTANNYIAPEFSPEKKAQIFANTTRKKTSLLGVKKKYFVEIALSLVLVFVIGFNLDYIQDLGNPIEIDYQDILDADLGVPDRGVEDSEKIVKEDASSDSLAVLGDMVRQDIIEEEEESPEAVKPTPSPSLIKEGDSQNVWVEEIVVREKEEEDIEAIIEEEKPSFFEKIFSKSSEAEPEPEPEPEKLAYEIVPDREAIEEIVIEEKKGTTVSELWDEKYFVDEETVDKSPLAPLSQEEDSIKMGGDENKIQLLELVAEEVLPVVEEKVVELETAETQVENIITEPVKTTTKSLMLVEEPVPVDKDFVRKQSISVSANSARLNFAFSLNRDQIGQDINIVCNVYLHGDFVDSFAYNHQSDHQIKAGEVYSFVDLLGSSYALHVLNSYRDMQFESANSGIKCSVPRYNIPATWVELAYE